MSNLERNNEKYWDTYQLVQYEDIDFSPFYVLCKIEWGQDVGQEPRIMNFKVTDFSGSTPEKVSAELIRIAEEIKKLPVITKLPTEEQREKEFLKLFEKVPEDKEMN
jgi:hypothetical protein